MSLTLRHRMAIAVLAAVMLFSFVAFSQISVVLRFEDMEPYIGQALHIRVVDTPSLREIARVSIPQITRGSFDTELSDLTAGSSLQIDAFIDVSGNGRYDTPPIDHAWRVRLSEVQMNGPILFAPPIDFTDIGWPPAVDGHLGEMEYASRASDSETGMDVHTYVLEDLLYVGLTAPGTGWLSIGFDPEVRMRGANIIIAAVADGEVVLEDHYGNSPISHRRDAVDHVIQAAGRETGGRSILEFVLPLDSGDDEDRALTGGGEVTVILAYHRTDDRLTVRHSERSTMALFLGG